MTRIQEKLDEKSLEASKSMTEFLRPKSESTIYLGGHNLKISNTQKTFFPEDQLTKGDLISYYLKIAPYILPYLKDRPESLRRYPDGIKGKAFFHKNAIDIAPEWVKLEKVSEENGEITNYLICNDPATLIFIVNLGVIDFNPWNSKVNNLNNPDYLILDLDPVEADFDQVVEVSQVCKKKLDELKIESFIKTSGATGMHIFIPTQAKYNYAVVRKFAEVLATLIHLEAKEITSLERTPQKRIGKIYLDYLQNARGQTIASAYSVRPFKYAPVSTPLFWEEVKKGLLPEHFNIKNIFERLEKKGDPFKKIFLQKPVQIEKVMKEIQ